MNITDVCIPGNLVYGNLYSTTYRAKLTIGGVEQEWDIRHISLPFPKEKEDILRRRFGMNRAETEKFYSRFGRELKRHMVLMQHIDEINNAKVSNSTLCVKQRIINKKADGNGSDIYLITEPATPFIGSDYMPNPKAIALSSVIGVGTRLMQTIKNYSDAGLHLGTPDLSTIYIRNVDSKTYLLNGSLLHAGTNKDGTFLHTQDAAPFMKPEVYRGEMAQSRVTDGYAVCALLWTLMSGKHYSDAPDFSQTPQYMPDELRTAIQSFLNEPDETTLGSVATVLYSLNKSLAKGELANTMILLADPSYAFNEIPRDEAELAELAAQRAAALGLDTEEDSDSGAKKIDSKKILLGGAICLLALGLAGIGIWKSGIIPTKKPEIPIVAPTATPIPDTILIVKDQVTFYARNMFTNKSVADALFEVYDITEKKAVWDTQPDPTPMPDPYIYLDRSEIETKITVQHYDSYLRIALDPTVVFIPRECIDNINYNNNAIVLKGNVEPTATPIPDTIMMLQPGTNVVWYDQDRDIFRIQTITTIGNDGLYFFSECDDDVVFDLKANTGDAKIDNGEFEYSEKAVELLKENGESFRTDGSGYAIIRVKPGHSYAILTKDVPEGYLLVSDPLCFDVRENGIVTTSNIVKLKKGNGETVLAVSMKIPATGVGGAATPEPETTPDPNTEPSTEPQRINDVFIIDNKNKLNDKTDYFIINRNAQIMANASGSQVVFALMTAEEKDALNAQRAALYKEQDAVIANTLKKPWSVFQTDRGPVTVEVTKDNGITVTCYQKPVILLEDAQVKSYNVSNQTLMLTDPSVASVGNILKFNESVTNSSVAMRVDSIDSDNVLHVSQPEVRDIVASVVNSAGPEDLKLALYPDRVAEERETRDAAQQLFDQIHPGNAQENNGILLYVDEKENIVRVVYDQNATWNLNMAAELGRTLSASIDWKKPNWDEIAKTCMIRAIELIDQKYGTQINNLPEPVPTPSPSPAPTPTPKPTATPRPQSAGGSGGGSGNKATATPKPAEVSDIEVFSVLPLDVTVAVDGEAHLDYENGNSIKPPKVSSANPEIATASLTTGSYGIKVTGISPGTTTLTVTFYNGKTQTVNITVTE